MGLKENLSAAEAAVNYVKGFGLKATNLRSGRAAEAGGFENLIGTDIGDENQGPLVPKLTAVRKKHFTDFRKKVAHYISSGVGNCTEQAEIAMLKVFDDYPKVRPLDVMAFTNDEYDHVWLGIGLEPDWDKPGPKGKQNLRNWGKDAVWCDPWQSGGVWFAVDDLVKGKVRNLSAIYKCNTAERVAEGKPASIFHVD